eukprot:scpid110011/ scgid17752/ 
MDRARDLPRPPWTTELWTPTQSERETMNPPLESCERQAEWDRQKREYIRRWNDAVFDASCERQAEWERQRHADDVRRWHAAWFERQRLDDMRRRDVMYPAQSRSYPN